MRGGYYGQFPWHILASDQSQGPGTRREKKSVAETSAPEQVSIGRIRGWAFGLLGLSRRDFYEMRVGEFFEALSAYREEKANDRKHIGELVRGATIRLINIQLRAKDKYRDPAKFWRMPWDESDEEEAQEVQRLQSLSEEEMTREAEIFLKKINH